MYSVHHLEPPPLQIGFTKIAWVLNVAESNFVQSMELTN